MAVWNIQVASELKALTPSEVALVVVKAMDFCLSFRRDEGGFVISKAIEEPSKHLAKDGAQELYCKLEETLLIAQRELEPMLKQAKESFPPLLISTFTRGVALNHMSLRLLMSRLSRAFDAADNKYIVQVRNSLHAALPFVDEAVTAFRTEQASEGTAKDAAFYTIVRDMTYNYAATYPA